MSNRRQFMIQLGLTGAVLVTGQVIAQEVGC
jgi:hypothetical protein